MFVRFSATHGLTSVPVIRYVCPIYCDISKLHDHMPTSRFGGRGAQTIRNLLVIWITFAWIWDSYRIL